LSLGGVQFALALVLLCLTTASLKAAPGVIYANDFEAYTAVATALADEATDADPVGIEWNMADDTPLGAANGSGVQVIDWLPNHAASPTKALLLRSGTQAQIYLHDARSGSRYQLDFWVYSVKTPPANRGWYVLLRGEGSDINGDDYLAYQSLRDNTTNTIRYYDGVGPGTAAWVNTGIPHATNAWQHHRIVIDPNALKFDVYLDDMVTPVLTGGDLSRCEVGVPTIIQLYHEGNTADDGYCVFDDISLTVDDPRDLTTTFIEGFESYPARVNPDDDADPQGPWVTTEVDGTGLGRLRAPVKVQVVDSTVDSNAVKAHSGNKCLKLEAGQRAGSTLAWGVPPQSDVQITWWAYVPASVDGQTATYLRMSLYGAENFNTVAGDNALLGYGSRDATTGDETSLTYYITGWLDSGVDYIPNTWEEYRLTTHANQGRYTIVKNPSTSPQVITDRAPMIGTATNWLPVFMAAWSSSNGTNHPPVYVDDIEIKSLVANAEPLPEPYVPTINGERFTNFTKIVTGGTIGDVAVDPRDNTTILFTMDVASGGGGIYRAGKVASGNWAVDPTPVVGGLSNPSGIVVAEDGTLWWVHDFTMALMRLKAPWAANTPELVVTNFGSSIVDDDTIDLAITPASMTGSRGQPNWIAIADRGCDGDTNNAVLIQDPNTTTLYQTNNTFLVDKTLHDIGNGNLNAITALPASGEVVALSEDGFITAINGDGTLRYIYPMTLWPIGATVTAAALAVDPTTGRLWLADEATDEIWSIDASVGGPATPDIKELSFPLIVASRPERTMDFHDPTLAFAPDGKFLAVTDTSVVNGGGRLIIFHSEPIVYPSFSLTNVTRTAQGVVLNWSPVGAVTYDVLRATEVGQAASYQAVATNITSLNFTDTSAPAGAAFYRVVAKP
jgi:hypothetical protein